MLLIMTSKMIFIAWRMKMEKMGTREKENKNTKGKFWALAGKA